jgi:hypothetical protein
MNTKEEQAILDNLKMPLKVHADAILEANGAFITDVSTQDKDEMDDMLLANMMVKAFNAFYSSPSASLLDRAEAEAKKYTPSFIVNLDDDPMVVALKTLSRKVGFKDGFLAGSQSQGEQWISVERDLPTNIDIKHCVSENMLVCKDGIPMAYTHHYNSISKDWWGYGQSQPTENITHWQPLTAPAK